MSIHMLFPKLVDYISALDHQSVSDDRKAVLQPLADYISAKDKAGAQINLNFICTHNSRRSHLSQCWAQAIASYYNIPNVQCYSAGTEATAIYPTVLDTLFKVGFQVTKITDDSNPIQAIKYGATAHPIIGFSKTIDHNFNPSTDFAAVMTCSQADHGCPFISGADKRIPITYEDPKSSDGTADEEKVYLERSSQIATEMKYVFFLVSEQLNG